MAGQTGTIWSEHMSVCEHCGINRPVAIVTVLIRTGKAVELAICGKCEAKLAKAIQYVIARQPAT